MAACAKQRYSGYAGTGKRNAALLGFSVAGPIIHRGQLEIGHRQEEHAFQEGCRLRLPVATAAGIARKQAFINATAKMPGRLLLEQLLLAAVYRRLESSPGFESWRLGSLDLQCCTGGWVASIARCTLAYFKCAKAN